MQHQIHVECNKQYVLPCFSNPLKILICLIQLQHCKKHCKIHVSYRLNFVFYNVFYNVFYKVAWCNGGITPCNFVKNIVKNMQLILVNPSETCLGLYFTMFQMMQLCKILCKKHCKKHALKHCATKSTQIDLKSTAFHVHATFHATFTELLYNMLYNMFHEHKFCFKLV